MSFFRRVLDRMPSRHSSLSTIVGTQTLNMTRERVLSFRPPRLMEPPGLRATRGSMSEVHATGKRVLLPGGPAEQRQRRNVALEGPRTGSRLEAEDASRLLDGRTVRASGTVQEIREAITRTAAGSRPGVEYAGPLLDGGTVRLSGSVQGIRETINRIAAQNEWWERHVDRLLLSLIIQIAVDVPAASPELVLLSAAQQRKDITGRLAEVLPDADLLRGIVAVARREGRGALVLRARSETT